MGAQRPRGGEELGCLRNREEAGTKTAVGRVRKGGEGWRRKGLAGSRGWVGRELQPKPVWNQPEVPEPESTSSGARPTQKKEHTFEDKA